MLPELIIAATIMAESGGEGIHGRQAVAGVIVYRARERDLSPAQVCRQKFQFSCWNKTSKKEMEMRVKRWERVSPDAWAHCLELAVAVQNETFLPIIEANHYYNPSKCNPKWAKKLKNRRKIGNHVFGTI